MSLFEDIQEFPRDISRSGGLINCRYPSATLAPMDVKAGAISSGGGYPAQGLPSLPDSNPLSSREQFEFAAAEFYHLLACSSKELSKGAMLTAPSTDFDDVFHEEVIDDDPEVKFTTPGTIVNNKFKPTA